MALNKGEKNGLKILVENYKSQIAGLKEELDAASREIIKLGDNYVSLAKVLLKPNEKEVLEVKLQQRDELLDRMAEIIEFIRFNETTDGVKSKMKDVLNDYQNLKK